MIWLLEAVFTPQIVANRQNDRVYAALDAVLPRMSGIEERRRGNHFQATKSSARSILTIILQILTGCGFGMHFTSVYHDLWYSSHGLMVCYCSYIDEGCVTHVFQCTVNPILINFVVFFLKRCCHSEGL